MVRSAMMGARVRRKEDPRLITGSSIYVDDLQLKNMTHAAFYRSPYAHATITDIDTSAARAAPGVIAVYTNEELREFCGTMIDKVGSEGVPPEEDPPIPTPEVQPMAQGKVRWVGEPVVVVLAESAAQARDAVELISIDFEELPAAINCEAAMADGAPQLAMGRNDARRRRARRRSRRNDSLITRTYQELNDVGKRYLVPAGPACR